MYRMGLPLRMLSCGGSEFHAGVTHDLGQDGGECCYFKQELAIRSHGGTQDLLQFLACQQQCSPGTGVMSLAPFIHVLPGSSSFLPLSLCPHSSRSARPLVLLERLGRVRRREERRASGPLRDSLRGDLSPGPGRPLPACVRPGGAGGGSAGPGRGEEPKERGGRCSPSRAPPLRPARLSKVPVEPFYWKFLVLSITEA